MATQAKPSQKFREFVTSASPVLSMVEFGLSFSCLMSAWFSTEIDRIIPALFLGCIFAILGLLGIRSLSYRVALGWCLVPLTLFSAVGLFLEQQAIITRSSASPTANEIADAVVVRERMETFSATNIQGLNQAVFAPLQASYVIPHNAFVDRRHRLSNNGVSAGHFAHLLAPEGSDFVGSSFGCTGCSDPQ